MSPKDNKQGLLASLLVNQSNHLLAVGVGDVVIGVVAVVDGGSLRISVGNVLGVSDGLADGGLLGIPVGVIVGLSDRIVDAITDGVVDGGSLVFKE
eukprot:scaffold17668_cov67-Attheya_sp.AAC.3